MAWKEYCVEYWLKELWESKDGFTGHHDIIKILLKTVWNTIQSIDQSISLAKNTFPMQDNEMIKL